MHPGAIRGIIGGVLGVAGGIPIFFMDSLRDSVAFGYYYRKPQATEDQTRRIAESIRIEMSPNDAPDG